MTMAIIRLRKLTIFVILMQILMSGTQNFPQIPCPQFFQFITQNNQYYGLITTTVPYGQATLDAQFSYRNPLTQYGQLSLYEKEDTTVDKILRGQAIYYRVTFPTQQEFPKLTRLAINGQEICRGGGHAHPSFVINLTNTIHSEVKGTNFGANQNPVTQALQTRRPQPQQQQHQQQQQQRQQQQRQQQPQPQAPVQQRIGSISAQSGACGREGVSAGVTPFIYGGREVYRGQFPWLVVIYVKSAGGIMYICGGSLISAATVISAAHCFEKYALKPTDLLVYLGRYNLVDFDEQGAMKADVQALRVHPEYKTLGHMADADIALLYLRTSVRFTNYIQPICLWSEASDVNIIAGHRAYVAGWGEDERGTSVTSIAKVVDGTVANDAECDRAIRESYPTIARSSRSICLASDAQNSGPCSGDSGNGLMMQRNGRWHLRGIVSYGYKTVRCRYEKFVYFCDTAKHLGWIRSQIV